CDCNTHAETAPDGPADPGNDEAPHSGGASCKSLGGDLLSHPASRAVPSALEGLTSGFGMGPGGSPPLWPPKRLWSLPACRNPPELHSERVQQKLVAKSSAY